MTRHTDSVEVISTHHRRRRWPRAENAALVRKHPVKDLAPHCEQDGSGNPKARPAKCVAHVVENTAIAGAKPASGRLEVPQSLEHQDVTL